MPAHPRGGRATGDSGASFTPSKANLFEAVKAIFHPTTNPGVESDDGNDQLNVGAGAVGRAATLLATKTASNAVSATAVTQIDVAWLSAAGGVANSYDEILIEAEYGSDFVFGLMPRAKSMVDSKVYNLLTGDGSFFPTFAIAFTETNPRGVRVRLQAATAQSGGTLRVWGITYQGLTTGDGTAPAWNAITGKPDFGSAALADTGTGDGDVPVLGAGGVLPEGVIPAGISRDTERQAAIQAAVTALIDGAPGNRDTLKELADAIAAISVTGLDQTAADARYLRLAGGTMTGPLVLQGAPTQDLHPATKKYVDDNAGDGGAAAGDLNARVERINFDDVAPGGSNLELTPSAGGISVVNGAGDPSILSAISGNDFTVAAGVYLVNVHGDFNASSNVTIGFDVRRASDDAELDQSNTVFIRSTRNIHTSRILLILAADTAINFFATRSGNISMSAIHAEFVKLSSGGNVHSAHNRGIGWAAQQVPSNAEIIAATVFTSDVLTIPNPDPDDTIDDDDTPGWLFFYVPDDAGAPNSAYFDGNTHDILGGFTRLASGTFDGHIVYGSNAEQDPAILGTGSRTLTLGYD